MENFSNFHIQNQIQQIEVFEQVDPAVNPDDKVIIGYGQLYDMCVAVSFLFLSVFGNIYIFLNVSLYKLPILYSAILQHN